MTVCSPNETFAGHLAHMFTEAEMDSRVLGAVASENHWRWCPAKWREESRRAAARTVRDRAEDAGLPEWLR